MFVQGLLGRTIVQESAVSLPNNRFIPQYSDGFLKGILVLGMGLMIALPQARGVSPSLRHVLKRVCKNSMHMLFLIKQALISLCPGAFWFRIAASTSFLLNGSLGLV